MEATFRDSSPGHHQQVANFALNVLVRVMVASTRSPTSVRTALETPQPATQPLLYRMIRGIEKQIAGKSTTPIFRFGGRLRLEISWEFSCNVGRFFITTGRGNFRQCTEAFTKPAKAPNNACLI